MTHDTDTRQFLLEEPTVIYSSWDSRRLSVAMGFAAITMQSSYVATATESILHRRNICIDEEQCVVAAKETWSKVTAALPTFDANNLPRNPREIIPDLASQVADILRIPLQSPLNAVCTAALFQYAAISSYLGRGGEYPANSD